MKPARNCRNCFARLTTESSRFTVASDSEGGPTGDWCGARCYTVTLYGAEAERVYAGMFALEAPRRAGLGAPGRETGLDRISGPEALPAHHSANLGRLG